MLLLQQGRAGLSAPPDAGNGRILSELRRTIARMQAPAVALDVPGACPLGVAELDRMLGGGLAYGALHEIAACGETHIAAATGFALGVAALSSSRLRHCGQPCCHSGGALPLPLGVRGLRDSNPYGNPLTLSLSPRGRGDHAALAIDSHAAVHVEVCACLSPQRGRGRGKTIVWVTEDMALIESGTPYGPGLDLFGLAPERLLTVAAAKTCDVLWTMEEALHCRAVGVVIGEMRSASLDLVTTRRLSLAAAAHGALALLLRTTPGTEASAAATRWVVGASPSPGGGGSAAKLPGWGDYRSFQSSPPPDRLRCATAVDLPPPGGGKGPRGIGPPRFDLALTRNRRGPLGSWMLEWSPVDASFVFATHLEPVAGTAVDRPDTRAA